MSVFTFKLVFQPIFLVYSIVLLFLSRALSIFPLSYVVNKCRETKITLKNQVIMWFSGMRGAVAFALALHMELDNSETKRMLLTSTLFIVLFTIIFMGGSALPLIKILSEVFPDDSGPKNSRKRRSRRRRSAQTRVKRKRSPVILSKTQERGLYHNSDHLTEYEDSDGSSRYSASEHKNVLTRINESIVRPLFVRKFTHQERLENKQKFRNIAFEALRTEAVDDSSSDELLFNSTNSSETIQQPLLPK
jgi:sodium/hydrogen exchanger 8